MSQFTLLRHWAGVLSALALLSGCVSVHPVVQQTAIPKSVNGYVAGVFSASGAYSYGLGIVSMNGNDETVLPFYGNSTSTRGNLEQVSMIEIPAGRYRISSWLTFDRLTHERHTRNALSASIRELQFEVKPGRVTYIGKFEGATAFEIFKVRFRIEPKAVAQNDLELLFQMAYPNFSFGLVDPQPGSIK